MKKLTKRIAALSMAGLMALVLTMGLTPSAHAQFSSDLTGSGSDSGTALGTAFALGTLFRNGTDGILNPNGTDIGDVFILDRLFGLPGGTGSSGGGGGLGQLAVLNVLFHNHNNGLLSNNSDLGLGDAFLLNQLFR
jgi:hypothetical protein